VRASLGIAKDAGRNWGGILAEIKNEIDRRNKEVPSKWTDSNEKKFFSSVHASLSAFKTSWRNPTMHHEHSYSEDDARNIFIAVRSIMKAIASRMDEDGQPTR
jgi:hypothetical protein